MSTHLKIMLLIVGILAGVLSWSSLSETRSKLFALSLIAAIVSGWIGYQWHPPTVTSIVVVTATATATPATTATPTATVVPTSTPISPTPLPRLTSGMSHNGTLAKGEVDTYGFTTQERILATIDVEPVGPLFSFAVQVTYADGDLISEASTKPYHPSQRLSFAPEPGLEYLIKVVDREQHGGSYIINLTIELPDK